MKILLLTTVYPSYDINILNNTSVCHYFAREWVKMGHTVKVIYSYPIYIRILHWIASIFESQIAKVSNSTVQSIRLSKDDCYEMEGVRVERYPLFKPLPHGKYLCKSIIRQIDKIIKSNETELFVPDIIVGHFHHPNLEIVSRLKDVYNVPTCLVLHGHTENISNVYKSRYKRMFSNIDVWGYRSIVIQRRFERQFGKQNSSFICYSGIPENYITNCNSIFDKKKHNSFVFVGALIKRKYPISLIMALSNVFKNKDFHISYVGKGSEESKIRTVVKKNNINNCVTFWGHLPRSKVQEVIESSEYFVMISENETFGLVYLEAMAKGCITIAAKNEGMDGIIHHGENGFLCEAGDEEELTDLIKYIINLSKELKLRISKNAVATAKKYTEYNAAAHYINSIINETI